MTTHRTNINNDEIIYTVDAIINTKENKKMNARYHSDYCEPNGVNWNYIENRELFFLVGVEVTCGCTGAELMSSNFQILNNIISRHGKGFCVVDSSVDANDDIACVLSRYIGALLCAGDDDGDILGAAPQDPPTPKIMGVLCNGDWKSLSKLIQEQNILFSDETSKFFLTRIFQL